MMEYVLSVGIPQMSVFEPLLWKKYQTVIVFADDFEVQKIGAELNGAALTLTKHKTEAALVSGRKIMEKMVVTVKDSKMQSNKTVWISRNK